MQGAKVPEEIKIFDYNQAQRTSSAKGGSNPMKTLKIPAILTVLLGALALTGCATPLTPQSLVVKPEVTRAAAEKADRVGGDYYVNFYRGLPGDTRGRVHLDAQKLDDLAYLHQVCMEIIVPQEPGGVKSVSVTTAYSVTGQAGGAVLGSALESATAPLTLIAKGNAGAGLIYGVVGGTNNRFRAQRETMGPCMSQQVVWAQRNAGRLINVGIITNVDSAQGPGIQRKPGPMKDVFINDTPKNSPTSSYDDEDRQNPDPN